MEFVGEQSIDIASILNLTVDPYCQISGPWARPISEKLIKKEDLADKQIFNEFR